MRSIFLATCALAIAAVLGPNGTARAQTPVLTVLTYESFASEWGPGPAIEEVFEATCACDLDLVPAGDGAQLLARLRLEGARSRADVVLGLDAGLMVGAEATGLFAPHGVSGGHDLPVAWDDPLFVPFDWGWFALVHDTSRVPVMPTSFAELAASDLRIVIQDPRSSTPGLGLVMWLKAAFGDQAGAMWRELADNVVTVTPGWSAAYELFLKDEADAVLSYTTSPGYHLIAEGDATKAAVMMDEGNYLQVEVAGLLANAPQPELGRRFLEFLLTDEAQSILPETNWMYPARMPAQGLSEAFAGLPRPSRTLFVSPAEAHALRDAAVAEWRDALSR